jgi:hypothetical protein
LYGQGTSGFATSTAQGNPGSSYAVPNAVTVYRSIGAQTHYQFDCYVPANGLCDFFFGCNSAGVGYACRVEARAGQNCGVTKSTNWLPSGFTGGINTSVTGPATAAAWHTVTIDIGSNLITMKIDGTQYYSGNLGGTISPMGSYIGLTSELVTSYYDNVWIGYAGPAGKPGVQWYNVVTQYGADPTNTVDSTAAINAAIVACNATGYGGIVYLPPGWYTISSPVNFNGVSFVELRGDGTGSRLRPTAAFSGAAAITVTGGGRNEVNNLLIQFAGAWNTNTAADGIQVAHSTYFKTDNVEVLSPNGYAINIISDATSASSWAQISRCTLTTGKGGINLQGLAGTDTQLIASITECMLSGAQTNPAINVQDAVYAKIDKCTTWGNQTAGIAITGASSEVLISNCDLGAYSGSTSAGLLIQNSGGNSPGDIYVSNSYIAGGLYAGQVAAGARIFFANCVFAWAQSHGLFFSGVAGTSFVSLVNCLFTTNARTAGTCYELMWSGNGFISVVNCQFGTWVNTTPTAGYVAASMNFTAGISSVSNCVFLNNVAPGTGSYAGRPTYSVNNHNEPLSTFLKASVSQGLIETPSTAGAYAPANGGTIITANVASTRLSGAAATTGVIMAPGTIDGQEITVINEGAGSMTFAASGSNVSDGGYDTIAGGTAKRYIWSTRVALWFPVIGVATKSYYLVASASVTPANDSTWRIVNGTQITFTVSGSGNVNVTGFAQCRISTANTTVNAFMAIGVYLDGVAQTSMINSQLSAQNSGIGMAGALGSVWNFAGLAPGQHTCALGYWWNGTANAATFQMATINAMVDV